MRRGRSPRLRQRAIRVLAGAATLLTLVGCSVSVQDGPERLSLANLRHPSPVPPVTLAPVIMPGGVCLVQRGRLVWVSRSVPWGDALSSPLGGTLQILAQGPTSDEAQQGIRSALPAGITRLAARISGHVALVAVPRGFDDLSVSEQILAVGQLVYTAVQSPGVTALQLTVSGRPVPMPVADGGYGGIVQGPVTRANFTSIAPG